MSLQLLTRYGLSKAVSGGGGGPDGTTFYVEVTIPAATATLTDFPVYLDLNDMPAGFWTNVQADGGDIRVTESDGSTRCPVDLVAIDTGSSIGELHFLASSVSAVSGATFRLYYGHGSLAQPTAASTYGSRAVWDSYDLVSHGAGDTDATGKYTFSDNGGFGSSLDTAGKVGRGRTYSGSAHARIVESGISLADTGVTHSYWLALTNTTQTGRYVGQIWNDTTPALILGGFYNSVGTRLFEAVGSGVPDVSRQTIHTYGAGDTSWHHIVVTNDLTTSRYYFDGTEVLNVADDVDVSRTTDYRIGGSGASNRTIAGTLDEVRVANAAESPATIIATHANQSNPTGFYSIGAQQAA